MVRTSSSVCKPIWRLIYLNKLHAIEDARKGGLLSHFNLDVVLIDRVTAFGVKLSKGLQKDEATESLQSRPLVAPDKDVDLFARLEEPF